MVEMEIAEVEAVLEKIWDLHDKLSDAIHSISRTHFLNALKPPSSDPRRKPFPASAVAAAPDDDNPKGFVYVKDWDKDSAITEARSLNSIRTALEDLEDQLEFFHTVQIQQRAERDAAYARLEQSRIIVALRLAEHHGKRYKVIEEALDFITDVQEASCFVSPKNLSCPPATAPAEHLMQRQDAKSNIFTRVLSIGIGCAKRTLSFEAVGGAFGNAALFAISMIAVLHFQQVAYKNNYAVEINSNSGKTLKKAFGHENTSPDSCDWSLDVLSARG